MAKTRSADRQRYWREAIERQQASGQSIVGFCAKEGLSPASFHAWKRRLRRPRRETGRKAAKQALVPVQIVSDPTDWRWESWKSSGLAASCCGSRAVTCRRSAQWSLPSRPRQHEGHADADACPRRSASSPRPAPPICESSFEGLVGLVERELGQQVESGDLFLFFNRRGDRVKVLWFAGDGLVIWYKRLEGWNL